MGDITTVERLVEKKWDICWIWDSPLLSILRLQKMGRIRRITSIKYIFTHIYLQSLRHPFLHHPLSCFCSLLSRVFCREETVNRWRTSFKKLEHTFMERMEPASLSWEMYKKDGLVNFPLVRPYITEKKAFEFELRQEGAWDKGINKECWSSWWW